jgi:pimeloyl-ACP methyl ester carboxylesterase
LTQPSHRIAYRGGFLAVELMGPEDGWPLFFFHGWPGSRMQRPPDDRELRRAGARLVTMDRPGLGHSTPVRHRRVADWGAAVEAVADHLGIARFAVLGVSGGGPYALAVAAGLAHRVRRVLVCGGVPPQSGPDAYRTLHPIMPFFGVARHAPGVLRLALRGAQTRTLGRTHFSQLFYALVGRRDGEALRLHGVQAMIFASLRETFRQGPEGAAADARAIASPWGFRLRDIAMPVTFWHGTEDRVVPPGGTLHMASRMPQARVRWLRGEGHYSPLFLRMGELLEALAPDA